MALLCVIAVSFHLEKAKAIEKVGDFMRKRTKFGEIFLHKVHDDVEEVVL